MSEDKPTPLEVFEALAHSGPPTFFESVMDLGLLPDAEKFAAFKAELDRIAGGAFSRGALAFADEALWATPDDVDMEKPETR